MTKAAPVPHWLTADQLSRECRVSERTARRWISTGYMPAHQRLAVDLKVSGELGHIHPRWTGWIIHNGTLYAPGGAAFTPGEILAIPLRRQREHALERAVQLLQAHIRDMGQIPLFAGELPALPAS